MEQIKNLLRILRVGHCADAVIDMPFGRVFAICM
jgi:hypothetical protein